VTGEAIVTLLMELRDRHGATLILVTHAPELASRCDREIWLRDGRVADDAIREAAE
jgi:putative ABC transport system ATP-binding protein